MYIVLVSLCALYMYIHSGNCLWLVAKSGKEGGNLVLHVHTCTYACSCTCIWQLNVYIASKYLILLFISYHALSPGTLPDEEVREQVFSLLRKQEKRAQARQQRAAASQQQPQVPKLVPHSARVYTSCVHVCMYIHVHL